MLSKAGNDVMTYGSYATRPSPVESNPDAAGSFLLDYLNGVSNGTLQAEGQGLDSSVVDLLNKGEPEQGC